MVETGLNITDSEFNEMMSHRPIVKFKPVKNSLTKAGDKILLAKTLGIAPSEVNDYIKNVSDAMQDVNRLSFLPKDRIDAIKTYVFRHGSKDDLVVFLNYELTKSKNLLKTLYTTLDYYSGGVADYFIRPIHRMDNKTLIKIYNVIDKNLKASEQEGKITKEENLKAAKWALYRIYTIQNNNKLINAVKTYNILR